MTAKMYETTTYSGACDKCRWNKVFESADEAIDACDRHNREHLMIHPETRVHFEGRGFLAPYGYGTIKEAWYDMRSAYVILDQKQKCDSCGSEKEQGVRASFDEFRVV